MARDFRSEGQPASVGALVGAALRAMLHAQALAQQETLDYIENVGLDDARRAVTIDFDYEHPVPDPLHPGEFTLQTARVSAPVLSLVQVPSLQIDEATIDLVVHVLDAREVEEAKVPGRVTTGRLDLVGILGRGGGASQLPAVSISMKIKRREPAESYEQVKRILADAVTVVPSPATEAPREPDRAERDPEEKARGDRDSKNAREEKDERGDPRA